MYDNCVKQNDSLSTMLNRKKEEYEQQMLRNEDLAGKNSEQIAEMQRRVSRIIGNYFTNNSICAVGRRDQWFEAGSCED